MGGDGGVVAAKREFMRAGGTSAAPEDEGKSVSQTQAIRSRLCALSQTELQDPVVACKFGNLYNKEAVLGALLDKNMPSSLSHIRKMKLDVKEVKFHVSSSSGSRSCPLTGLDFNGVVPFFFIWPTGFVLSEKAVKEMGMAALQEEYGPFSEDELVKLLPLEGDANLEKAKERMKDLEEMRTAKKKKRPAGEKEAASAGGGGGEKSSAKKQKHGGALTSTMKEVSESISNNKNSAVYSSLFHKS